MTIHDITYLSILVIGIILLTIFYFMLGKSIKKLPDSWKKSFPSHKFKISILFLTSYLFITFAGEIWAFYLSSQGIYNSFVISINLTLATPFLFGFLFSYTQTTWKHYCYILLYVILVGYFIIGRYYHPDCILSDTSALLFSSIYFLAALLYLTDLLVNPKSEHFKFRLKICICILIYNLLGCISTTVYWSFTSLDLPYSDLFYYIQFYNILLYYFSLDLIFMIEILKLRRR